MKIDKGYLGMGFVIFCMVCVVATGVLSAYADPVESDIEIIDKSAAFIHIDHDSGFLSSDSVMASYQAFEGNSGHIWVRVERYGFDHAFEFSVDTIGEAETILRGLAE